MDFSFENMRIPLGEEFQNLVKNEPGRFPEKVMSMVSFSDEVRSEVFRTLSVNPDFEKRFKNEVSNHFKNVVDNRDPFDPTSRLTSNEKEDLKIRFVNDELLRRILFHEAVDPMDDIDIVMLIVNMLTQQALMQVDRDRNNFQPVEEKIIRDDGEDVATTTSVNLPFVRGGYIRSELSTMFQEMTEIFSTLSIEDAVTRGCLYFYLLSVLHPQHDFNGRMMRYYINHKIHKSTSSAVHDGKRLTLGKGPFGDKDVRFIEGFIKPIDEKMRFLLFQEFLPELKTHSHAAFFAQYAQPLVMLHSFQHTDHFLEQLATSSNMPSPDPQWIIGDPIGITDKGVQWLYDEESDVTDVAELFGVDPKSSRHALLNDSSRSPLYTLRFYMCRYGIKNLFTPERLREQLTKMYRFDETPQYFPMIRKIVNDALQHILSKASPVFRKLSLHQNPSEETFSRYRYTNAYEEIHGQKIDFTYMEFIDMILYGLEKYRVPVQFSPFIAEVIENVANKKGANPFSPEARR